MTMFLYNCNGGNRHLIAVDDEDDKERFDRNSKLAANIGYINKNKMLQDKPREDVWYDLVP